MRYVNVNSFNNIDIIGKAIKESCRFRVLCKNDERTN